MKLLDYMRDEKLDDDAMASRLGDCSGHAVKKWKYGERVPSIEVAARIERATEGRVGLRDWVRADAEPLHLDLTPTSKDLSQVASAHQ